MSRDDWYRNSEWSDAIEEAFFAKLRRARDKSQYLRIQASYLADRSPHVTLRLLEQYFALGSHFDHAQGYVDRATAHLSLGDIDSAIKDYESALATEATHPNLLTNAYIKLPFLVATSRRSDRYEQALKLLHHHKSRLTFPVDHFRWHAARALILSETNHPSDAKLHAKQALDAASKEHSGFRYHQSIGLVRDQYENLRSRLLQLSV
jgi:tetratricopeptide (TPR) repeat protein